MSREPFPFNASEYQKTRWLAQLITHGKITPTLQDTSGSDSEGQTYTTQKGQWVRIGDYVAFSLQIAVSSIGTLTGGDPAYISGLPFDATSNTSHAVSVANTDSLNITAGEALTGWVAGGDSLIGLEVWDATTGTTDMTITEFSAGGALTVSGHYFAG